MRAQGRQMRQQRVREDLTAHPPIRILAIALRLLHHVRQQGGQSGVGLLRDATRESVVEIVALALSILSDQGAQVAGRAGKRASHDLVRPAPLPVGQHEKHRQTGNQTAEQRILEARPDDAVAVQHLIETAHHHQRDRPGRQRVAVGAPDEEGHARRHGDQPLDFRRREQRHQRPTGDEPEDRRPHIAILSDGNVKLDLDVLSLVRGGPAIFKGMAILQGQERNAVAAFAFSLAVDGSDTFFVFVGRGPSDYRVTGTLHGLQAQLHFGQKAELELWSAKGQGTCVWCLKPYSVTKLGWSDAKLHELAPATDAGAYRPENLADEPFVVRK